MASHTVALDGEAYAALKSLKRGQESFSDVVKRIAKPRGSILEFAGAWKNLPDRDWKEMELYFRRSRDADKKRMAKLIKAWEGT